MPTPTLLAIALHYINKGAITVESEVLTAQYW